MQKQQILVVIIGLATVLGLYFLGPTVSPERKGAAPSTEATEGAFNIELFRNEIFRQLPEDKKLSLETLENQLQNSGTETEKHKALHQLAGFWKDSVVNPPLHYFYAGKLAELDNTEKSLTFAAHSILGYLPFERNHDTQHWLANRGKELFEKALTMNAANDSTVIGIGGCIMYGASDGGSDNPMAGIMKVREVAERDSTNMYAQYMLGVGGIISKQYDRAAQRFAKVAAAQPENMEVMFKLAEAYELSNQNELAAEWYGKILQKVENPDMRMELTRRISMLKGK
jgi:tetratricopeptide (TPR) repeat protein